MGFLFFFFFALIIGTSHLCIFQRYKLTESCKVGQRVVVCWKSRNSKRDSFSLNFNKSCFQRCLGLIKTTHAGSPVVCTLLPIPFNISYKVTPHHTSYAHHPHIFHLKWQEEDWSVNSPAPSESLRSLLCLWIENTVPFDKNGFMLNLLKAEFIPFIAKLCWEFASKEHHYVYSLNMTVISFNSFFSSSNSFIERLLSRI